MFERIYPMVLSVVVTAMALFWDISLKDFLNYKEIMSSAISLGSIAVGFLAAAITLMPSLSNNELVKNLKSMGAYKKLLKYIISAIISLFCLSLISLLGLFINNNYEHFLVTYFQYLWVFILVLSIMTTIRVISLFLKFLIYTQDGES